MEKLLSFSGRIRRQGFWIVGLALSIPNGIISYFSNGMATGDNPNYFVLIILWILSLALAIIGLSLSVRRWHDLNKSGWWVLINLIPIIGWIYSLVMLGFMPGDQGANSHGPAPEPGVLL